MTRAIDGLNDEGLRLVALYASHNAGTACNCTDCKTVRRLGLLDESPARPVCCGREMSWQGDPANGFIGYECQMCGANDQMAEPQKSECHICHTQIVTDVALESPRDRGWLLDMDYNWVCALHHVGMV